MIELLERVSAPYGPSGNESAIREVVQQEIAGLADEVRVDALGSLIAIRRPRGGGEGGRRVLIAAHMDEIGIMVTQIDERGFARFVNVGFVNPNTLLGAQCGDWLRRGQWRRIAWTGLVLLVAGYALHHGLVPMNKKLWTPSFAVFAGGFAALGLVVVHLLIDVRGWPPIGRRFGVNAITAYAGSILLACLLDGTPLHRWLYGPLAAALTPVTSPVVPSHLYAAAQVLFWWLVLVWMDRRRIRISI